MTDIRLVGILFVVRLFLLFGDRAFGSPWIKHSSLAKDDMEVAADVHDAINAKNLVITWPLLAAAAVIFRLPDLCGRASVFALIVFSVVVLLLVLMFLFIPFRCFQGKASSAVALITMTVLDLITGFIFQDAFLKSQFC